MDNEKSLASPLCFDPSAMAMEEHQPGLKRAKTFPDEDGKGIDSDEALASRITRWLYSDNMSDTEEGVPTVVIPDPRSINQRYKCHYEHQVVPLGPYNSAEPYDPLGDQPRGIDKAKQRCLRLSVNQDDGSVGDLIGAMKALEERALRCYDDVIEMKYTSNKFVMMLLLDGCFILEAICSWSSSKGKTNIFGVGWSMPVIRGDLLKLGNQIPFFVLECLFNLRVRYNTNTAAISPFYLGDEGPSSKYGNRQALFRLLVDFLTQGKLEIPPSIYTTDIKHLLHLYYLCLVHTPNEEESGGETLGLLRRLGNLISFLLVPLTQLREIHGSRQSRERTPMMIVPCAAELLEAGVTLRKKKSKSLLDVTFSNGILEIPSLTVDESARTLLINLLTYEQYSLPPKQRKLMSYANFMDCLTNTATDVAILQLNGIIENKLATNDDIAYAFSELIGCGSIDYKKHFLAELFREVVLYCESDWNRYRAKLKEDYFSNPWSTLSMVATVILLTLTVVQTFYTVYPYYYPPNPPC